MKDVRTADAIPAMRTIAFFWIYKSSLSASLNGPYIGSNELNSEISRTPTPTKITKKTRNMIAKATSVHFLY